LGVTWEGIAAFCKDWHGGQLKGRMWGRWVSDTEMVGPGRLLDASCRVPGMIYKEIEAAGERRGDGILPLRGCMGGAGAGIRCGAWRR